MYGRTYGSMDKPNGVGGGGQMSCSCAKTLHEALDVLHRKHVDFDQFMVISVLKKSKNLRNNIQKILFTYQHVGSDPDLQFFNEL